MEIGSLLGPMSLSDEKPPSVGEHCRCSASWCWTPRCGWATLLLGDADHSRRALSRAYRLLEVKRARSDGLLRNMLPEPKQREEVIADAFGEVTVLFADIVDFTEHAGAAAEVALEMLNVAERRSLPMAGRSGCASGSPRGRWWPASSAGGGSTTTCGGDMVNTASRMETIGVPGCIQVTERTCELLGDRYLFQERAMIQVKGKGEMLTYLLSGRARQHDQMLDLTEPH